METTVKKLLVIKSVIESNKKINTIFIDGSFEKACELYPALTNREIISCQIEDVEISKNEYLDENGILVEGYEENPNYNELMKIKMSDKAEAEGQDDRAEELRQIGQ